MGVPRSDFMAQSLFLSHDVCPGLGISPLRTNIWLSFCGLQSESRLLLCCAPAVYMLAADAAVAAAVFCLEHLISYCNHTKRCFGPTSRGQRRRLCHAMPNHRPG